MKKIKKKLVIGILLILIIGIGISYRNILKSSNLTEEKLTSMENEDAIVIDNTYQIELENAEKDNLQCFINGNMYAISDEKIECTLQEGKNNIIIQEDNGNIRYAKDIFYIKPYQHQFLEELSTSGLNCKLDGANTQETEKIFENLENLGNNYVRIGVWWQSIYKGNTYDFSAYDTYINECREKNKKILMVLGFPGKILR